MKEAIVSKGPTVNVIDVPIPEPNENQVLIKVVVSGSNPKDWKLPDWWASSGNQGDDIAGIVHKVGANVVEFKPGDRVAAFHEMRTPHGSYAEYAIAWQHTTFHIPQKTSFEEASTLPLAALTSVFALYQRLELPQPWTPAKEATPLAIWGASSAIGIYAIQLALRSNIHPIIAIAGASAPHVESFLDKDRGDVVIDYRKGEDAVVESIKKAVGSHKLLHAYDCITLHGSFQTLSKVLAPGAKITLIDPAQNYEEIPKTITWSKTSVGESHRDGKDLAFVFSRYFTKGLAEGWFRGQRHEVVPGGLGGVQTALENLKADKAHGIKYVFRIADTEGVEK